MLFALGVMFTFSMAARDFPWAPYVLYLGAFYVLTPGSHGLRRLESWIGGNEIEGVTGVASIIGLLTAIALGMLVAAAAIRPARADI